MIEAWLSPRRLVGILVVYILLHLSIRVWQGPTLGLDDAEQALFAQHWLWSYRFRAPPLFTWLLMPVSSVVGMNMWALSLMRYALLATCAIFAWKTARLVLKDTRLVGLSALSLTGIYVFAYYSHDDLTHTTMMATMVGVFWYGVMRWARTPTLFWYLFLGLVAGLGTLGKWNFLMLPAALCLAGLFIPRYRALILSWRIIGTGLVGAAMLAPSILWILHMGPSAGDEMDAAIQTAAPFSLAATITGFKQLAIALLTYPQPFFLLFVACFGKPLIQAWRGAERLPDDRVTLMGATMLAAIFLHALIAPMAGTSAISARWMQPVLMVFPLWLFAWVEVKGASTRAINGFLLGSLAFVIIVLAVRVAVPLWRVDVCKGCRLAVPFETLATQLKAAGYAGNGTIVVDDFHRGGNMRVQFPTARVVQVGYPLPYWPTVKAENQGMCLLVWYQKDENDTRGLAKLTKYLDNNLHGDPLASFTQGTARAFLTHSEKRAYYLGYRLYTTPQGDCR